MNSKRRAHCNKVRHPTLLEAQISLKRTLSKASKRGDPIVTGLSAYKCPYCPGWHVGRSRSKGINWEAVASHDAKIRERTARAREEQQQRKTS